MNAEESTFFVLRMNSYASLVILMKCDLLCDLECLVERMFQGLCASGSDSPASDNNKDSFVPPIKMPKPTCMFKSHSTLGFATFKNIFTF